MRTLSFLFIASALMISCLPLDEIEPIVTDHLAVVSPNDYDSTITDGNMPVIAEAALEGDVLSLTYCDSGCDGSTWVATLYDSGEILESSTIQRNLVLHLENIEICTAFPCKTETFDISSLQIDGENSIYLNFYNNELDSILYEY